MLEKLTKKLYGWDVPAKQEFCDDSKDEMCGEK